MARWSRYFPGHPEQVAEARRFVLAVLAGHPEAESAALVVSELCTNAVCHTFSGGPDGLFAVTVSQPTRLAGVGGTVWRGAGAGLVSGPQMPRRRRRLTSVSALTGEILSPPLSRVLDSSLVDNKQRVTEEYERIASIADPYELLRAATERLAGAQQEVTELARLRRRLIQDLHAQGLSYAQIAEAAGLSRGRVHQIRHTGPAPEGAFLGLGEVTVVTPLRQDTGTSRSVVALDDLSTGKRIEDLARTFGLAVGSEHVRDGEVIDLDRAGLIVVCGPRMSPSMGAAYDTDPVIRWERGSDGVWVLRDTRAGTVYRSGSDSDPARPSDVAYLGRLPGLMGRGRSWRSRVSIRRDRLASRTS
jgi:hypothetical protein